MEPKPSVTLALTVHEPNRRLLPLAEAHLSALAARYSKLSAFCSGETDTAVLDLLRQHGVAVLLDDAPSAGIGRMGHVRRQTLRAGLLAGTSHLHLCDFDRSLHWVVHYPHELESVIAAIPDHDLLVLGRTERAWTTYPGYQAQTEPLFNHVFALVTGLPWDVGAGSRGLSRRAAQTLLAESREPTVGVDAEWPLLLLSQGDLRASYRPCEGLEFETLDRFGPEIEAAGGYPAWEAQMDADPRQWVFRLEIALRIAAAAASLGGPGGRSGDNAHG